MKTNRINIVLSSALALLVLVALAQYFHGHRTTQAHQRAQEKLWNEERAQWSEELEQLRAQLAWGSSDTATEHLQDEPEELIQMLYTLDRESERKRLRKASFCFQALTESRKSPIENIRNYYTSGHNVILAASGKVRSSSLDVGEGVSVPPTTRLGLVDVLRDIGTSEAIGLLSQVLPTALNASEATYIARILLSLDSELFRNISITTARNLLSTMSLARDEKRELLSLLIELQDTEMAEVLSNQLLVDGRLDRDILDFIHKTMGEDARPLIYSIFGDPGLTMADRADLLRVSMNYVGTNEEANELFSRAIHSEEVGAPIRAIMVLGLTGMSERGDAPPDLPAEVAQSRLMLLDSLEQEYGGSRGMGSAFSTTREQLEYSLNPGAYDERPAVDHVRIAQDIMVSLFTGNAGGRDGMGGLSGFLGGMRR
ncbi:MAG: hypothetical protein QM428_01860 [Verrucomicrobiota bacterium]|nr:hypothetical protein [Verrucomicrobiota bacterium]